MNPVTIEQITELLDKERADAQEIANQITANKPFLKSKDNDIFQVAWENHLRLTYKLKQLTESIDSLTMKKRLLETSGHEKNRLVVETIKRQDFPVSVYKQNRKQAIDRSNRAIEAIDRSNRAIGSMTLAMREAQTKVVPLVNLMDIHKRPVNFDEP